MVTVTLEQVFAILEARARQEPLIAEILRAAQIEAHLTSLLNSNDVEVEDGVD